MIHFLAPAAGTFSINEYLRLDPPAATGGFHVIEYESLTGVSRFGPDTYVFAGLEQLTPSIEPLVARLHDALTAARGARVLNDPRRSLRRLQLLDQLHRLGRNSFRAARAGGDLRGLRYPVFLRQERSHGGSMTPLLNAARDVKTAIGRALVQGYDLDDLLVVEFCETASDDGLYRKYSALRVGDHVHARCLNAGRNWMTKFETSDFTVPLAAEEVEYVSQNPHEQQLMELFDIAGIEFGQIDYAIVDGRAVTWEINMNPTIGRSAGPDGGVGPPEVRPIRTRAREFFFDRFREAWAAVDTVESSEAPVVVAFPSPAASMAERSATTKRMLVILRAILRPLKPVLEPVSAPLLRLFATVARSGYRR
jgi:hypothetical protein